MPQAGNPTYRPGAFAHLCALVAEALRAPRGAAAPGAAAPGAPTRLHALDRLDRWFWQQRQNDRDAYLARSTDIADAERRLRELERGARYY